MLMIVLNVEKVLFKRRCHRYSFHIVFYNLCEFCVFWLTRAIEPNWWDILKIGCHRHWVALIWKYSLLCESEWEWERVCVRGDILMYVDILIYIIYVCILISGHINSVHIDRSGPVIKLSSSHQAPCSLEWLTLSVPTSIHTSDILTH